MREGAAANRWWKGESRRWWPGGTQGREEVAAKWHAQERAGGGAHGRKRKGMRDVCCCLF
jgi:hypothetical protein